MTVRHRRITRDRFYNVPASPRGVVTPERAATWHTPWTLQASMRLRTWFPALVIAVAPWSIAHAADPAPRDVHQVGQPPADVTDPSGAVTEGAQASGIVTDVDQERGTVRVKLRNGDEITLEMPDSALHGFSEGDRVVVTSQVSVNEVPRTARPTGATGDGRTE